MRHHFIKKCLQGLLLCGAFCFFMPMAMAQDPGAFRYEVVGTHGVDQPAWIRIIANSDITNVDVAVEMCAPTVIQRHYNIIKKGSTEKIEWNQGQGEFNCRVTIKAKSGMSEYTARNMHVIRSGAAAKTPISLDVDLNEIGSLTPKTDHVLLKASAPFRRVTLNVYAEDASIIDSVDKEVGSVKNYRLGWTPSEKTPSVLEIKILNDANNWASATIASFVIAHTDVVFDTNKYNIRKDQEQYLVEPLQDIKDKIEKFDKVAVKLYITGHTDTVGSMADNDKLSMNRAKAIAGWFAKHGLKIPIYYRGVGERALFEHTPDNTENQANRRAVYHLTNSTPDDGLGGWKQFQ